MTATPSYESIADVETAAQKMRDFFLTGATLDVDYRRQALVKLKAYLKANEERILSALTADLGKAPFEGYATAQIRHIVTFFCKSGYTSLVLFL